jgi:hypothetical protein
MPNVGSPMPPRFQFSLRWMLVVMTVFALLLGLSAIFGEGFFPQLLFVLFPTPLVVAIIYSRGVIQTFAIGGLVPWISLTWLGSARGGNWVNFESTFWLICLSGLSGGIAVASRRWIERN